MRGLMPLPVFAIADLKDQWALDIDRGSDLCLPERNPLGKPALYFGSWCSRMASRTSRRSLQPFRCCRTGSAHRRCQYVASLPDQVTQPARSIEWLGTRQKQRTKLRLQKFANQGSCSFNHLFVSNAGPSLLLSSADSCSFPRPCFLFCRRKNELLLIDFQEFLDESLKGSAPHGSKA